MAAAGARDGREGALQFSDGYFLNQRAAADITYMILSVIGFVFAAARSGASFQSRHCSFYFVFSFRIVLCFIPSLVGEFRFR